MAKHYSPNRFLAFGVCPECAGPAIALKGHTRIVHEHWCRFALELLRLARSRETRNAA